MFDYIRCEVPLPDGFETNLLQTKDFDRKLVVHVITAEGRLLLDRGHDEEVPEHERPYANAPPGSPCRVIGIARHIPKMVDENFDGAVSLLGIEDGPLITHEYKAIFKDGQLVEIQVVSGD